MSLPSVYPKFEISSFGDINVRVMIKYRQNKSSALAEESQGASNHFEMSLSIKSQQKTTNATLRMFTLFTVPPTKEEVYAIARNVCLSVCLLVRLQKTRAWIWIKFCVSTGVGAWTNWSTFEPDPNHSPNAGTVKSESWRSVDASQTGTSLRAGYRSRDALQRDIVYSTL